MCNRRVLVVVTLATAALWSGCVDVRGFEGQWAGSIVAEPSVRQGFDERARVDPMELSNVTLQGLDARITTSDDRFTDAELTPITKAAGDALASLSFDGDPLRSYLLFAKPNNEDQPALMVLSLFGENHVELRIIRANDLFGVFFMQRVETP